MKKEKEWNLNEYQGRSKAQVESNNKGAFFSMLLAVVTIVSMIIYNLITYGI